MVAPIRGVISPDAGSSLPTDAPAWANQLLADMLALYGGIIIKPAAIGGSGDAMTATPSPAIPALVDGLTLWIKPPGSNSAADPLLNVSSIGNKTVKDRKGAALPATAYNSTGVYPFQWDAAGNYFRLLINENELKALTVPLPKNFKDANGFILSNNGADAINDIDISAGSGRNTTNAVDMIGAAMTKRLDAVWAAGNNQGGLLQSSNLAGTVTVSTANGNVSGSGTAFLTDFKKGDPVQTVGGQCRRVISISSDTAMVCESNWSSNESAVTYKRGGRAKNSCYRAFAIYKDADATVDYAFSGRDVPVDLPSGYTKYKFIGPVYTDGSLNNRLFTQIGKQFLYATSFALDYQNFTNLQTTPNQSAVLTQPVPKNCRALLYFKWACGNIIGSPVYDLGIGMPSNIDMVVASLAQAAVAGPTTINPDAARSITADALSQILLIIRTTGTPNNGTAVTITPILIALEIDFELN